MSITSMKHYIHVYYNYILVLRNNTILLSHTIHSEYGASTYEVVNHIQVSGEYVQYFIHTSRSIPVYVLPEASVRLGLMVYMYIHWAQPAELPW